MEIFLRTIWEATESYSYQLILRGSDKRNKATLILWEQDILPDHHNHVVTVQHTVFLCVCYSWEFPDPYPYSTVYCACLVKVTHTTTSYFIHCTEGQHVLPSSQGHCGALPFDHLWQPCCEFLAPHLVLCVCVWGGGGVCMHWCTLVSMSVTLLSMVEEIERDIKRGNLPTAWITLGRKFPSEMSFRSRRTSVNPARWR